MPILIREKRKVNFQNKIITPLIIQQIANIVDHEANNARNAEEYILTYSVDAMDNSSYESGSKEIFSSTGIIGIKTSQKIQMRFQTVSNNKNIEVQITHSQTQNDLSYVLVSGEDSVWVNGIITQLSETINSSDKQPLIRSNDQLYLTLLSITIIINILYFRLFYHYIDKITNEYIQVLLYIGVPFFTFFACNKTHTYLLELWPDIELQTGPNYLQIPSKKRKKVAWIITMILLPILLAFVYDVLKNMLHLF